MTKNVLIVTSEFPPLPGGIGNHAFNLAKALSAIDYSVTVLTEVRESDESTWSELVANNRELDLIGVRRSGFVVAIYLWRIWLLLNLVLKREWSAVIYSGKFPVWLNGIMPKTASTVVIHGSELKQSGIRRTLFQRGLKRARSIVCVSNYTKMRLVEMYPTIAESGIRVINNGVGSDWFHHGVRKPTVDRTQVKLITVGGIHPRKGQHNVVNALPAINKAQKRVVYTCIGLPQDTAPLLELVRRLKLEEAVVLRHGLSTPLLRDEIKEADIFVMLSENLANGDFEGFGIAVIEAMALGVPAIGSKNTGIADAIQDGISGRLVDPADTDSISTAVSDILENYENYSTNARIWAEKFQWGSVVEKYNEILERA